MLYGAALPNHEQGGGMARGNVVYWILVEIATGIGEDTYLVRLATESRLHENSWAPYYII